MDRIYRVRLLRHPPFMVVPNIFRFVVVVVVFGPGTMTLITRLSMYVNTLFVVCPVCPAECRTDIEGTSC